MPDRTSAPPAAWPLVALFTAGYVAPYLLPTVVGRLDAALPLSPARAGLIGSALLLGSAAAGFVLASRIPRHGPRPPARLGLLLAVAGYAGAAATSLVPLVVLGAVAGGFGSGTATAVAASGIAAQRDPHRTSALGLLSVSATTGALYLTLPRLGGGHGLPFAALGVVFAAALGAGLLGVTAASALGARLGRAVPIGGGTAVIACCAVLTSSAHGLGGFAAGEVLWNACYPVVLSYAIGLAAALDPRGRWAVLAGSASSLGVACGPVTGSLLAEAAGFPGTGLVLGSLLLAVAGPMTAVALHAGGRPLLPGSVRRRGGAPAAVLAASAAPQVGAPELTVTEIPLRRGPRRILLLSPRARRERDAARGGARTRL